MRSMGVTVSLITDRTTTYRCGHPMTFLNVLAACAAGVRLPPSQVCLLTALLYRQVG